MLPFRHPFTCIVSGPTQCGKTTFIMQLITHAQTIIEPSLKRIVYCYGEYQRAFDTIRDQVHFHEVLPQVHQFDGRQRSLLILDDLMAEAGDSVANVFTKISHHRNVSVVFLTTTVRQLAATASPSSSSPAAAAATTTATTIWAASGIQRYTEITSPSKQNRSQPGYKAHTGRRYYFGRHKGQTLPTRRRQISESQYKRHTGIYCWVHRSYKSSATATAIATESAVNSGRREKDEEKENNSNISSSSSNVDAVGDVVLSIPEACLSSPSSSPLL